MVHVAAEIVCGRFGLAYRAFADSHYRTYLPRERLSAAEREAARSLAAAMLGTIGLAFGDSGPSAGPATARPAY